MNQLRSRQAQKIQKALKRSFTFISFLFHCMLSVFRLVALTLLHALSFSNAI